MNATEAFNHELYCIEINRLAELAMPGILSADTEQQLTARQAAEYAYEVAEWMYEQRRKP